MSGREKCKTAQNVKPGGTAGVKALVPAIICGGRSIFIYFLPQESLTIESILDKAETQNERGKKNVKECTVQNLFIRKRDT